MTKSKTQLRGHCQCCGRQQAVRKNREIAHHGYTVENGFFRGPCSGHRFNPIEESRTRADEVVASVRASAAELRLQAEKTLAGLADPEQYKSGTYADRSFGGYKLVDKFAIFAEASEGKKEQLREDIAYALSAQARAGERFADYLAGLIEKVHCQPLIVVKK